MSVFDDPGVTPEESPTSDVAIPGAEGQTPSGEDPEDGNRLAELERKNAELESHLSSSLTRIADIEASNKTEGDKEQTYSVEELKAFAQKEDGAYQFDAAVAHTKQELASFKDRFVAEQKQASADEAIRAELATVVPDLADPSSEFAKRVDLETRKILTKRPELGGSQDSRQKAWEVALLRVTAQSKASKPATGETSEQYNARRKAEMSGAAGGGAGMHEPGHQAELTEADLAMADKYGIKSVNSTDPARRAAGRKMLLGLMKDRDDRSVYQRPYTGGGG